MATFCWRCPSCEFQLETQNREAPSCPQQTTHMALGGQAPEMVRDYKAEAVGLNIGNLKKTNDPQYSDSLFLPTARDFESPSDPDGSKGVNAWNERHEPRSDNKTPRRPKAPHKTVFGAAKPKKAAAT